MAIASQLHRSGQKPDWSEVPEQDQNFWQRLAANTSGIITPANAITLAGALFSFAGLIYLTGDVTYGAISLIIFGRLLDIADGQVAHWTGTKSPLGEMLDAAFDKLVIGFAIVVFIYGSIIPLGVLVAVGIQSLLNLIVSLAGKTRKMTIHPTLNGKFAAATIWLTFSFFLISKIEGTAYENLAWISFIAFVIFGTASSSQYLREFFKRVNYAK